MLIIQLEKEGRFLSGRSHAAEIAASILSRKPGIRAEHLVLDFTGVDSFAQSFASELLRSLSRQISNIQAIQFRGITDPVLAERLRREQARMESLKPASTPAPASVPA